jgi:hypothetical protein
MPQFLEPNAGELNALRGINKKIMRDMKRQYRGTESTLGLQGDIADKYTFVYEKMVEIITALGEISNQLKLGHTAPSGVGSKAIDRFIGGTSAVMKATKLLLNYMTQQVPSISIFPVEQQQTISSLNDQIVGAVMEIDQLSTNFLDPQPLARFRQVIATFKDELMILQQRLEGTQGDMGTGSLGDGFDEPSRKPATSRSSKYPVRVIPSTPKKKSPAKKSAGTGTEEGKRRYREKVVGETMEDMLDELEGRGYGKGYRTQIAGSGHMPSRFL